MKSCLMIFVLHFNYISNIIMSQQITASRMYCIIDAGTCSCTSKKLQLLRKATNC